MTVAVLLALDYPGRRDEARIADLHLEANGWDVRYLLQPPFGRLPDSASYAGHLARRFGPFGPEVSAVLAYCMAAPIAQYLAVLLQVPLVLFDGEPATAEAVERELEVAKKQLGWTRNAGSAAERFPEDQLRARAADCARRMREILVPLAAGTLRSDGVPEPDAVTEAGPVADFYLDWLTYLIAAHNTDWPRWPGPVFHVMSRGHGYDGDWPGVDSTQLRRVDSERNELLGQPRTRDLARAFLSGIATKRSILS
jgi:hypothetical protein